MSLADTELTIGGVKLKGIYIAVVFSLATTIGSFIWASSSLYGRLEAVEAQQIPDISPIRENLATLGTRLETLLSQQEKLLELKGELSGIENEIEAMKGVVAKAEVITADNKALEDQLKVVGKEINDLWMAMDDLISNPLR